MNTITEYKRKLMEIKALVDDCEEYQQSSDSKYKKEREKVIVYDEIVELLKGGEQDG